ncbi:pentapeptide repeat-containing protein [Nonomuraea sediminis]|uniref:pentapeptide repeat-containing protein n=1 Tax=Nonomuraea sediminis TaxID=2835864 RepID=UPI001BDBC138|nr:pentapeptide repeat-containing protein [Nonomuraea sediminis]
MRWRRAAPTPLSQEEFDALPALDRAELHRAARDSRRELVATVLQFVTALGVLGGLLLTAQGLAQTAKSIEASREELGIARKGQLTDRFTRAVEQLGAASVDVRVGGVYALEGIGRDAAEYRQTTVDVLATYVVGNGRPSGKSEVARDVQTALTVLGRVHPASPKSGWLDLSHARIDGATLQGAYLAHSRMFGTSMKSANLIEADLSGSLLPFSHLSGAFLTEANLAKANFNLADMSRASLWHADLRGTVFLTTDLRGADFTGAKLDGAYFKNADLRGAKGLPPVAELKKLVQWDEQTKWP